MDVAMCPVFKSLLVVGAALFFAAINLSAASGQSWSVEELTIQSPVETSTKSATLYLPRAVHRVSAIVMMINKSEAANWVQDYYAPDLARGGVAVLIVQEVKPLDLRNVLEPTKLSQLEMDAFNGVAVLRNHAIFLRELRACF